jgi:hypothetical protein
MRIMRTILYVLALSFSLAALAQDAKPTAPVTSDSRKLAIREAQHKLDAIEKQQASLGAYVLQIESKARDQADILQKQRIDAQAIVDKAVADAKKGVDEKLWTFDLESLNWSAVPQPPPTTAKK